MRCVTLGVFWFKLIVSSCRNLETILSDVLHFLWDKESIGRVREAWLTALNQLHNHNYIQVWGCTAEKQLRTFLYLHRFWWLKKKPESTDALGATLNLVVNTHSSHIKVGGTFSISSSDSSFLLTTRWQLLKQLGLWLLVGLLWLLPSLHFWSLVQKQSLCAFE